jgi:hypothetical protein
METTNKYRILACSKAAICTVRDANDNIGIIL